METKFVRKKKMARKWEREMEKKGLCKTERGRESVCEKEEDGEKGFER